MASGTLSGPEDFARLDLNLARDSTLFLSDGGWTCCLCCAGPFNDLNQKTAICSVSVSLDSAREQGVLLGDSRAWGRLLHETAGSGNLVLSLVMPFVPDHYLTARRSLVGAPPCDIFI